MRILLSLCVLLAVTGCSTYSLQELKTATPKGTPFQAQLATRYMRFSEDKAGKYNWLASGYFADKGLKAAYGHDVLPENVSGWNIPEAKRGQLENARSRLMAALGEGVRDTKPDAAAKAQASFDCWVQNQDAGWQPDEIAYCRDNFEQAMKALAAPEVKKPEPAEVEKPAAAPTPKKAGPHHAAKPAEHPKDIAQKQAYMVFFGMDMDSLDDQGQRLVDGVAADLKKQTGGYTVVLNGHSDTVGDKHYNFDLSRRRAQAVQQALLERGIPQKQIRAFGFGDTDPKVSTGPGVAEPKNRRVEIYIGDE